MEAKERVCPKCGTILMEDNFCMGCGAYVDVDEKKESEGEQYFQTLYGGSSDGVDSDTSGLTAEHFGFTGVDASQPIVTSFEQPHEFYSGYEHTNQAGTGNEQQSQDGTGNGQPQGSASAQGSVRTSTPARQGNPMPLLQAVLIMAGIAVAVFFLVFIVDMMTKLHTETAVFLAPYNGEDYRKRTYSLTYKGDQVEDMVEYYEFDISDLEPEDKTEVENALKQSLSEEYDAAIAFYNTMDYRVESDGSTIEVYIEFHYLDTEKGRRAVLAEFSSGSTDSSKYISYSAFKKTLEKNGWTQQ